MGQRFGSVVVVLGLALSVSGCLSARRDGGAANGDGDGDTEGGGACTPVQIRATRVDRVDLLFVVDDSESMAEERGRLSEQLSHLIEVLTLGDLDGDELRDFTPVRDLQVGLVSADLGVANVDGVPQCSGLGDDALLLHASDFSLADCKDAVPSFLAYVEGETSVTDVAADLRCIASLGTGGCGFEQPLEAALKALWPSADERVTFLKDADGETSPSHGDDASSGFLRDEGEEPRSALAIVVITDEDDCSSATAVHFTPAEAVEPGDPLASQELNLRCFFNQEQLFSIDRYVQAFAELKGGEARLVTFGAVAGVPADLVSREARAAVDFGDQAERDAYYQAILDDKRMLQVPEPTLSKEGGGSLTPSCAVDNNADSEIDALAYPPLRLVQLAQSFGANAAIQSICEPDFTDVLDPLFELIDQRSDAVCIDARPKRDSIGQQASCEVLWDLPTADEAGPGSLTQCSQRPWLESMGQREDGGEICRVQELGIVNGRRSAGDGWFIEDPTADGRAACAPDAPQRAVFTRAARPPAGVTVRSECCE